MATPTFVSVQYIDPWGQTPPGTFQAGVVVNVANTGAPDGFVLAAQLLQAGTPYGTAVGSTATLVRVMPNGPLSGAWPYTVRVQWVKQGTKPGAVDWTNDAVIATAPVLTGTLEITAGRVYTGSITLIWASTGGSNPPTGGEVQLLDQYGQAATIVGGAGNSAQATFKPDPQRRYAAYVQAAQPITPQSVGGYAAPFTIGPFSAPAPVPIAGPAITAVSYDGASLDVTWTPPPAPELPVAVVAYTLYLLNAGQIVASFPAGPSGARVTTSLPASGAKLAVAGVVRLGVMAGPLGTSQAILLLVPEIEKVVLGPSKTAGNTLVQVYILPLTGLPNDAQVEVNLLVDGVAGKPAVASGTPKIATFDLQLPADHRLEVAAYVARPAAAGVVALTGPASAPVALIAEVPTTLISAYDGIHLSLQWPPVINPAVRGYTVTLTPAKGNAIILSTGLETLLETVVYLDLSTTWRATLAAFGAKTTGLTSNAFNIAMPQIVSPVVRSIAYDGTTLTLHWYQAKLPGLTGYSVTLMKGAAATAVYETGLETTLSIPFTPDEVANQTITVAGVAPLRSTPPSSAVSAVTATPVIRSVTATAGNKAVVQWGVANPPSGASYIVELLNGDAVAQVYRTAQLTQTVEPTADADGMLGARVFIEAAIEAAVARGPVSNVVAVLINAPVISTASYDGERLTLDWKGPTAAGVLGHTVTLTPATGNAITWTTGPETLLDVTMPLALTTTWQVTVTAFGAQTTSPTSAAATVALPHIQVPEVRNVIYDGTTLTIEWDRATLPGLTGYRVELDGPAAATYQTGPETTLSVPLAPEAALKTQVKVTGMSASRSTGSSAQVLAVSATPAISAVTMTGNTVNVEWTVGPAPSSSKYVLELLDGDTVIATAAAANTGGQIAIAAATPGRVAVRGYVQAGEARGPNSASVAVLRTAPAISTASYDGERLLLDWKGPAAAGVLGYTVTLTPATGTAITWTTGPETLLEVAMRLNSATTWQVTVAAFGAQTTSPTSAAASVTMPAVQAPVIRSVIYDGTTLTVDWERATLPGLTGYTVAIALGDVNRTVAYETGPETTFSMPMTPAEATGTGGAVVVFGESPWRSTDPSIKVLVVADTPAISAVTVTGNTVNVQWTVPSPRITPSYVLELLEGDSVVSTAAATSTGGQISLPAAASGHYAVRGYANLINVSHEDPAKPNTSRGPYSASVAVLSKAPTLWFGAILDDTLTLEWAPPPTAGVTGYSISYKGSNGESTTVSTSSSQIAIPLGRDLAGGTVDVAAVGPNTTGPAASRSITPAYSIQSGSYDGATVSLTLGAAPNPAPQWLWVDVLQDGHVIARRVVGGAPDGAITTRVALPPGSAAAARATGVGSGALSPPSALASIPATAPTGLGASYDGTALHVTWQPVADPGITGYLVSVAGTSSPVAPVYVSGTHASSTTITAAFTLPLPESAKVSVQAAVELSNTGRITGPIASIAPSVTYRYYIHGAQSTVQPYLYRSTQLTAPATPAVPISLYLPEIFTVTQTITITQGAFTLSPTGATPYPYVMTFAADSAFWTFGNNAIRSQLQTDYNAFLVKLEAVTGGMTSFGMALLREVLALGLPLTFGETLYYRHGFDPLNGYCNVEPGMGLYLDAEVYQFVGTSAPTTGRSGFVPAGERTYAAGDYLFSNGKRKTGLNALLSQMQRPVVPANQRGSAGVIDLYATGFRRRYYRIFYPTTFTGGDTEGTLGLDNNVALLGCDTWKALSNATNIYLQTGNFTTVTDDVSYTFFRGRVIAAPLVQVMLNGAPQQVLLGTTVRELVQRYAELPMAQGTRVSALALARLTGNVVTAPLSTLSLDVSATSPVELTANPYQSVLQQMDAFDLPLLNGDRISIR